MVWYKMFMLHSKAGLKVSLIYRTEPEAEKIMWKETKNNNRYTVAQ